MLMRKMQKKYLPLLTACPLSLCLMAQQKQIQGTVFQASQAG